MAQEKNFRNSVILSETAFEDIDRALILQIDSTLKSVISRGALIHPNTIDTRNFYLKKLR